MARSINEKTLEINLCSEISRLFRLLGFVSVWRGLSQQEEKKWGFDTGMRLPGGRLIFIQWKAPKSVSYRNEYRFTLDDKQMQRLVRLAKKYPRAVYYGLPRVADWADFRSQNFLALPETRFFEAGKAAKHPSLGKQGTHTATIDRLGQQVKVTSIPQDYEVHRFDELFGKKLPELPAMLTGALNLRQVRRASTENMGFLIADHIHPDIYAMRNVINETFPRLSEEEYKAMNEIFEGVHGQSLRGLYVGFLFDALEMKGSQPFGQEP